MSLRNIMIAVVVVLGLAALYKTFGSKATVEKPKITASATTPSATAPVPTPRVAVAGEKPRRPGPNDSYGIVREYIKGLTALQLPQGYKAPEYISSGISRDEVYQVFASRHPSFYGFGSTQLLDSIRANPAGYELMLDENKAIRNQFDPNSKY